MSKQTKTSGKRKTYYVNVPADLAQSNVLDAYQFRILILLASFNPCFPSIDKIQKATNISRSKICSSIKVLESLGYLDYARGGSLEGKKKSNLYNVKLNQRQSATETSGASLKQRQSPRQTTTGTPDELELVRQANSKYYNSNINKLNGEKNSQQMPYGTVGTPIGIGREHVEAKGRRASQKQISEILGPLLNPYRYQKK